MEEKFTVLIIDDDKTSRIFLKKILLKKMSAQILEAENGSEGIQYINEFKPDLVITDLMMPGIGGVEVIEVLRVHPELKDTPIVVVSSIEDRQTIANLAGLKILDYILKPFDILHTGIRIKRLIEGNPEMFRRKIPVFL